MHGSYARLPCGVTLTGSRSRARSTRAFYPRRTELEGSSRAPGAMPVFPSAAVSWRSGCGISPIKYGSPADCWIQISCTSIPNFERMNLRLRRYSFVRVAADLTSSTTSLLPKRYEKSAV